MFTVVTRTLHRQVMLGGRFSEKTDVWSFAITLIELYTNGARPYPGMKNAEVKVQLAMGFVLWPLAGPAPRPPASRAHMDAVPSNPNANHTR